MYRVLTGNQCASMLSRGQRFMTELLVSSLMTDGGLESSLEDALRIETQVDALKEEFI